MVLAILATVATIAAGQLLFKAAANAYRDATTALTLPVLIPLLTGLAIYGMATLAWVWVLQYVTLSRAYPFMALAFILVPLASMAVFGERLDLRYGLGVAFICIGVALTAR
jgi:drug/metabolite transporter (DMT)-like permease